MNKKINIIFDFDSTLVKIEGIDELARLKNKEAEISVLTNKIMENGDSFEEIFQKRLEIVRPTVSDLDELASQYNSNLTAGAGELMVKLKKFCNIFIISGGYKTAILKTAERLGIKGENTYANELIFDKQGRYLTIDKEIPLWRSGGKAVVVEKIKKQYPGRTILIGDGHSDLECSDFVDLFICFTGVVERKNIVSKAQKTAPTFECVLKEISDTYPQFSFF